MSFTESLSLSPSLSPACVPSLFFFLSPLSSLSFFLSLSLPLSPSHSPRPSSKIIASTDGQTQEGSICLSSAPKAKQPGGLNPDSATH